jgi:murein DD-endopeptidase MepM/ murein hydrolase activator NlpD
LPAARPRDPRDTDQYVNPIVGKVISPFGSRDGGRHDGIDIKGVDRAPISASFPGRVIQAGYGQDGYGISVTVDLGAGVTTLFAHLSAVTVHVGDQVEAGDKVGVEGQTGRATTPHLHYEIRINGRPVNPAPYLH